MERIKVNPYAFPSRFDDVKFDASDPAAKSMTIQSAADECDVNQIVDRALKTATSLIAKAAGRLLFLSQFLTAS